MNSKKTMTFCSCCEKDECSVHFTGLLWQSISEFLFPSYDLHKAVRLKAVSTATSLTPFNRIFLPAFFLAAYGPGVLLWREWPTSEGLTPWLLHEPAQLSSFCAKHFASSSNSYECHFLSHPTAYFWAVLFLWCYSQTWRGSSTQKNPPKPLHFILFTAPTERLNCCHTLVCRLSPYHLSSERRQSQKWVMFHSVYRKGSFLLKSQTWVRP